jgi:hypothetical protein
LRLSTIHNAKGRELRSRRADQPARRSLPALPHHRHGWRAPAFLCCRHACRTCSYVHRRARRMG